MPDPSSQDSDLVAVAEGVEHLRAGLARLRQAVEVYVNPGRHRSTMVALETAELALDEVLRRSGAVDAGVIDPPGTIHGENCDCCRAESERLAEFDREHPPATCEVCGDILNAEDMPEHHQQMHGR